MNRIQIDCVQLQRDLREQAFRKYGHLSMREEVEAVRNDLRGKGLWRLFSQDRPQSESFKAADIKR